MVEGRLRLDPNLFNPFGSGNCITIERRSLNGASPGPVAATDNLVGIGFTSYHIRTCTLRCAPAREPSEREIKAPPEEMDRTALPQESAPELPQHGISA